MITSYKKAKDDVLTCYNEFLQVANQVNGIKDDRSLQILAEQAKKIKEDKFCLMIAGEAKSGKSTFINAYLGVEILPMDVRQCTSSVVEIRYGEEFVLYAKFADGREREYRGEDTIKDFLVANAALDDEYRDIPVTTINNEIIVKYKDKRIPEEIIRDLLKGVERENIHRLPRDEYEKRIRTYIKKKQPDWKNVVEKIEIQYPFEDKSMRGVRIIDSPGVNAAGRVGNVTAAYIESADAIMFLRPITGVAIEAESFKEFLESKSVDRNKNAMFLILTRAAAESNETIERARDEFVNMFGVQKAETRRGIVNEQIISVDSKAELYHNSFQNLSTEEIKAQMKNLTAEKRIEPFLTAAWFNAEGEKEAFLRELKKYSNFDKIDQSLNRFGRKAQFLALSEFLGRILKMYAKIAANLREEIENYKLKAKNPAKLAVKVEETKAALTDIENKMNETVDNIAAKYAGSRTNGIIAKTAEKVMNAYLEEIECIEGEGDSSLDKLEKISYCQVDKFVEFEDDLQKKVVAECNEALVALSDKNSIEFVTLEPDFSKEVVDEIKTSMRDEAKETESYTEGVTFKKTRYRSVFSQHKFYHLVKNSILERMDGIKQQAVKDLRSFVRHTVIAYTKELARNADAKRDELTRIKKEKKTADEIAIILNELNGLLGVINPNENLVKELKGGIDGNV